MKALLEPLSLESSNMATITLVRPTAYCFEALVLTHLFTVSDDFNSYCQTQDLIDESYKNQDEWVSKSILSVARMGFFTSGRSFS